MAYSQIIFDVADSIATITLNRPDKLNAYTRTMAGEIMDAMDRVDADDAIRAVIFTGAGDRAFCAGADLTPDGGGGPFSSDEEAKDLSDDIVRDGGRQADPAVVSIEEAADFRLQWCRGRGRCHHAIGDGYAAGIGQCPLWVCLCQARYCARGRIQLVLAQNRGHSAGPRMDIHRSHIRR